ncbi:MAG: hypothetical protein Q8R76_02020 [Candidatus Omnitrophota bacterium]|nr:hypothetical protein [Candidatus Omnitrophota bacterium]
MIHDLLTTCGRKIYKFYTRIVVTLARLYIARLNGPDNLPIAPDFGLSLVYFETYPALTIPPERTVQNNADTANTYVLSLHVDTSALRIWNNVYFATKRGAGKLSMI